VGNFVPKVKRRHGKSLAKLTFSVVDADASDALYAWLLGPYTQLQHDQLIIDCPDGPPGWLTRTFELLAGSGIRASVTPEPEDPRLLVAIHKATARSPYEWGDSDDEDIQLRLRCNCCSFRLF
jgi:hypothetical protein